MSKITRAIVGVAAIVVAIALPATAPALLGSVLWSVGASLVLGVLAQSLAPKVSNKQRRNGQELEYTGTVEPRRIIYGTNKVSGMNVIPPWTSGTNNEMLHQVLALAGHAVDSFGDVYFNDDLIKDTDIRGISNTLNSGIVESGVYKDVAWIRRRLGSTSQAVDFILTSAFPTQWDANHVGKSVAYMALQFKFDEEIYRNGKPEVSVIVNGKRCYDPRLDTGGVGDDPTDLSFIKFTSNPALILADYLTDTRLGLGEDTSRIDWDLVVFAANVCDENVLIPPASPTTHQKRYTCNIVLEVALDDEALRNNITILASAMLGQAVFTNGKWKLYAGTATTPTFALTADELTGSFTIRTEVPSNEKYNYVRGQFVDKDRSYQLSEFEPIANATYETEDLGKRYPKEVNFVTCTDQYEAQRNGIIISRRSRRRKQLTADFGMTAYKVRVWDVGTMTMDEMQWNDQPVRCASWMFSPTGSVQMTLLEEDHTDWDDPLVADYSTPLVTTSPPQQDYVPPDALNFTASSRVDGIQFTFEYPPGMVIGSTQGKIYEGEVDDPFSSAVAVTPLFSGTGYLLNKSDIDPKDYWLVLVNIRARPNTSSDPVGPVTAKALDATTDFHVNISQGTAYTNVRGSSVGTSVAVTLTPVRNTGAVTYAWTRISGDTIITANSPTSASSSFSVTGLAVGEKNTAKFRGRATDSTAATADAFVTVTFLRDDLL